MTTSKSPWPNANDDHLTAIEFGYDLKETARAVSAKDCQMLLNAIEHPPEPCDRLLKSAEQLNELVE